MKLKCTLITIMLFISLASLAQNNFAAYYTKITQGQDWEAASRTGKYADLVVRINADIKLVFWRGNSYLPYLETNTGTWNIPEVIPRSGDGSGNMPDKVNTFSHVRLISIDDSKAIVHWRYLPSFGPGNPKTGENHRAMVDEVFTILPDGSVTRTIKLGDSSYDHWEDPMNVTTQTFNLTTNGITNTNTSTGSPGGAPAPVIGNPEKGPNVVTPAMWWKFDEGQGHTTTESISGYAHTVTGDKTNWKKGVSGTALALDGYYTDINLPSNNSPSITSSFTIELWMSIGAYPWETQSIVHKGTYGELDGFGLYLNEQGALTGHIRQGGQDIFIEQEEGLKLPTHKWMHVAMVVDPALRVAKIFIDGQLNRATSISNANLNLASGSKYYIGSGMQDQNWFYTIDALIDEVRVYDTALSNAQIQQSYNNFNPGTTIVDTPDMDQRIIPEGNTTGQFGAHYERLPFYDTWDQMFRDGPYSDIVVEYDNSPVKTIFWRAASYAAVHHNGAKGRFSSEFNENFSDAGCCYEPMSDKKHQYSHARVIENTPARVVVHWRYPQLFPDNTVNNFNNATGWGDWSDWYMYCYPDGITAYESVWWGSNNTFVEWAEPMIMLGPGEFPDSLIPMTNTVTNISQTSVLNWHWSAKDTDHLSVWDNTGDKPDVQTINLTGSSYRPVLVYDKATLDEWTPYYDYNRYSHWPAGQKPSAGENDLLYGTRTAHTSILKPLPSQAGSSSGTITNGLWKKHIRLEGMSNRDVNSLRRLSRSWQNAPTLSNTTNVTGSYAFEQRAFNLTASDVTLAFTVDATEEKPLDNPCFVIKNWVGGNIPVIVLVNGSAPANLKQGTFTDTDGTTSLVIYINMTANAPTNFNISASSDIANNYKIETTGETCSGKNNGNISITAPQSGNYVAKIDGSEFNFTSTLDIPNLTPKTYNLCITNTDEVNSERCYEVIIGAGINLTGKSSINPKSTSQMNIDIDQGTAPYIVKVNNKEIGTFNTASFSINVSDKDLVEVTSTKNCEGKLSFTANLPNTIKLYPNPVNNNFSVSILTPGIEKIQVEVHNITGQVVHYGEYTLRGNSANVPVNNLKRGLYLVKVATKENNKVFKVVKQ